MKNFKSIILTLFILSIGLNVTLAQDVSAKRFTVKTNPLAALGGPIWVSILPITGEYRVLFEAKTTAKQSITIGASYLGPSLILNLDDLSSDQAGISGIKTSGFRGQLMYKFFLSSDLEAPEGLYLGPHFSYAMASIVNKDVETDKFDVSKLKISGVIGYQLISNGGFALDLFTGLGLKSTKYSFEGDATDIFDFDWANKSAATVAFGFSFGYAF